MHIVTAIDDPVHRLNCIVLVLNEEAGPRGLDSLMSHLDGKHQQAHVDYATFLVQQYKIQTPVEAGLKPKAIARPEQENRNWGD